jgi:phosphoglycerate dehydrogenase-like enzyme
MPRRLCLSLLLLAIAAASCATPVVTDGHADGPSAKSSDRPVGSSEGSLIALDTQSGNQPLLYLAGGLNRLDAAAVAAVAANLEIVYPESAQQALELAPRAHGAEGRWATAEFLEKAEELRWVQATSAGVDRYLSNQALMNSEQIVFTNMQGMHGPTIADHVFGLLLTLTRDLRIHAQEETRGKWLREGSQEMKPVALEGRTLLVVGLGGIGREVAKRGKGFGMTVWATKRRATPAPAYVDRLETSSALMEMLPKADVIVLCVPLTDETRGMLDADAFAAMQMDTYLINIARGPVVDTDAMVTALKNGTLAGAGLDVTDPEPLPADHPLWSLPNVIITPHIAARSSLTREDWNRLYRENLRRFAQGEPLLNVVDKTVGY